MSKKNICIIIFIIILMNILNAQVRVKIKNLVTIEGLTENSLIGYGLVTGLNGTGDSKKFNVSQMILSTVLNNLGINLEENQLASKNTALVVVSAKLPPNAKIGEKIDIHVASIGDAKSIDTGLLLQAPLKGMNEEIYAVAEGVITISDTAEKNGTYGIIPGGGILQKEFISDIINNNKLILILNSPDFNTIIKIRDSILESLPDLALNVMNDKVIEINVTDDMKKNIPQIISQIQNIEVVPETKSTIVINKNSGVIVMSGDIRLMPSAVSYKNIDIYIKNQNKKQEAKNIFYLNESSDIQSLIDGLNQLGAKTKDIIAILYTLKKANALYADIIVE